MSSESIYFAYGSNMSEAVLIGARGLRPRGRCVARLRDWALRFDLAGLPFIEPAFASVCPLPGEEVWGVAWSIDDADFERIRKSESRRYRWVDVEIETTSGSRSKARTLRNASPSQGILPSQRYRDLIANAARDEGLPEHYVEALAKHPCVAGPIRSAIGRAFMSSLHAYRRAFDRRRV